MARSSSTFQKGHPVSPNAGRPKGSKSNKTLLVEYLSNMCVDNFPDFLFCLKQLKNEDPKAYCEIYLKATERVIPKMAALQFELDKENASATEHLRLTAAWQD